MRKNKERTQSPGCNMASIETNADASTWMKISRTPQKQLPLHYFLLLFYSINGNACKETAQTQWWVIIFPNFHLLSSDNVSAAIFCCFFFCCQHQHYFHSHFLQWSFFRIILSRSIWNLRITVLFFQRASMTDIPAFLFQHTASKMHLTTHLLVMGNDNF